MTMPSESQESVGSTQNAQSNGMLIGITGYFGTGKSTLAACLRQILGAEIVGFADALKDDVHRAIAEQIGRPLTHGEIVRLKPSCLGPIYQGHGELVRQLLGEDYWIRRLEQTLPPAAIVADVRHENEAQWLKARGGVLLAVTGKCRREGEQRDPEHPSEAGVALCTTLADAVIANDRSVYHLDLAAWEAMTRLGVLTITVPDIAS